MEILNITSFLGFAIRLALAIFLGFIVGFERQWTKHQAGILTNVIVCVGAYAYTAFSYIALGDNIDVTRIAAQVVSGVGFLGAGLILRDGAKISGLSTAVCCRTQCRTVRFTVWNLIRFPQGLHSSFTRKQPLRHKDLKKQICRTASLMEWLEMYLFFDFSSLKTKLCL